MKLSLFSIICTGSVVASDPDGVAMLQNRKISSHKNKKSYGCEENTDCSTLCQSLNQAAGRKEDAYAKKQSAAEEMSSLAAKHSECLVGEKKLQDDIAKNADAIAQNADDIAKKAKQLQKKNTEVEKQAAEVASKAAEVAEKRDQCAAKRAETAKVTDEINVVSDDIKAVGDEIKTLAETEVKGKKCKEVLEKEAQLGEKEKQLGEKAAQLSQQETQLLQEEAQLSEQEKQLSNEEKQLSQVEQQLSEEAKKLSQKAEQLSQEEKNLAKQASELGKALKEKTNSCTVISDNQKIAEQAFVAASDFYTVADSTWVALDQKRLDVERLMQARTSAEAARDAAQPEGTKTSWQVRIKTSSDAMSGTDCPIYVNVGAESENLQDTEGRWRGLDWSETHFFNPFPKNLGHEHNHHENGQVDSHTINLEQGPPSCSTVVLGMGHCSKLFPGWKVEWFEFGGERMGGDVLNVWLDNDCRSGYKNHQKCLNAWTFRSPKIQRYFDAKQVADDATKAHKEMCEGPVAGGY